MRADFNRVSYAVKAGETEFRFPFKINDEKDLRVSLVDTVDLEQVPLILGRDYEVSGLGADEGGQVGLTVAGARKAEVGLMLVIKKGQAHLGQGGLGGGGYSVAPDFANMETTNRISASGGSWTADRDGYVFVSYVASFAAASAYARLIVLVDDVESFIDLKDTPIAGRNWSFARTLPIAQGQTIKINLYQSTSATVSNIKCLFIPPK